MVILMLTNVFILAVRIGPVEADETFIFQDDFENYNVGDFPSTGGWELVFNGQGDQYQIVTDTMSFSGSKSFQLWGYPNWAAVAQKKFDATSPVIGYEFAILIDAVGSGGPGRDEHPGFFNREAYIWGKYYATVRFNHDDMKIYAEDGTFLGQWSPREWYHIKVILDKSINKYNVWINGELRGENLSTTNQDTELINALALNSDHPGVKVYYDDVKIMVQGSINNDIAPLPAKALAPDGSLIDRALLISVSPGQTVVVSPGQTVSLTVGYQIWQGSNPNEIDQMFFLYSWSPTWPPPSGYYAEIYNSIPPGYPGETGTRQVDITVPTTEGAYYLWVGWGAHYSVPQAVQAFTQQPSLPAHVKIVVQTTAEYSLSVSFAEAYMNGETLTSPDSTIYLNPGESIQGYLKVYVNNNRGGPWITPVIGTVSWGRQVSGSVEGWFTAISYDAPTGTSLQTFSFNLNAPSSPGTYYIGVFTGWMDTADEVASGDHPANYGDGDDVWDMRQSDWEAVTSYGQAPEGAVYRMPGRAIRIIVQGTVSLGPPGTYVQIFWKRDNNYNFDIDLNVTDAPESVGSGQAIFWAHFFSFVGGNRGYIGLQIVGSQKKAIFSIWDAITGEPGNPFEEQGHGWQIIIDYDWKLNHKYRLRIWELNVEQNGDEWWLATVYDYSVGVDTVIGKILVPASWGWLDATSLTWVEYAGYDNCESKNIPYTKAVFFDPYARNPVENSGPDKLYVTYGAKPANNSDVDYYGDYTYALEAGDDVVRDTPEGWLTMEQDTIPPSVRVLSPNGGESLAVDSTFRIQWEATDNVGVDHVIIWLFQDSNQIAVIASNYPNTGYFDWTVPDRAGSGYKVRIAAIDAAGNAGYDDSDSPFSIKTAGFPYFEVEVSPTSQTVNQGGTAAYTIIVKSFNGFNRQISFTGYAQSGISLTFNPVTVTPPANGVAQSWLTVATSSSLAAGKYGVSIECKDVGGQVKWATIELNVVEVHRIESTVLAANTLPFNRLFPITVRVKNFDSTSISLKVVLEERTGFQAGVAYGDGDEIKDLTLSPGEEVELSFRAKVYGVPRVEDVARFRFYVGGQLIEQKDQTLNLNPEFAEVSTFTCPAAVKMGSSFTVGVPVFYSFTIDTALTLTLTSKESGKNLVITDVLNGDGMKIYSFRVDSSFVNLNSEGIRNFEAKVETKYPEENYKPAYERKCAFKVRVSNNIGTSSIIPDSGFVITLNYNGIRYFALYAYNATEAPPPQSGKIEDTFRWAFSRRNWLIFEAVDGNLKPVMDDGLYKTLAFASEIAYIRATMWNEYNLLSRSDWFKDLSGLAKQAEAWNFVAKLAGKLAGIIGGNAANVWASSVTSGIEAGTRASDIAMTVTRTVEILKEIKFYENVLSAVNKVGASEDALVWTSIFLLDGGSADLEDANRLLTTVSLPTYPPFVINVNVDEALTFYRLIQSGETKGLSGMRFLSTHYAKDQIDVMGVKFNIGAFKNALVESLGVVGTAYEFYENLKNKFNIPEVFEFAQHIVTLWDEYEMRREICQSASLKFRDTYIKETSNCIAITLTEPETQHKLYLSVYDMEGRIIGFNRTSGTIESQIPNSYYIDLGNMIKVNIPLDVNIKRIVIDAAKAEFSTENYTLEIEVYKDENIVSTAIASGQVSINAQKEYGFQLTEDLKPILNEATPYIPLQYVAVAVAVAFILTLIALTLISKRKKHTAKPL